MGTPRDIIVGTGDLASEYKVGDWVWFENPNDPTKDPVAHRIVLKYFDLADGELKYLTKGDKNDVIDEWTLKHEEIIDPVQELSWEVSAKLMEMEALGAEFARIPVAGLEQFGLGPDPDALNVEYEKITDYMIPYDKHELYNGLYNIIEENENTIIKCLKDLKYSDGELVFKDWYKKDNGGNLIVDEEGNYILNDRKIKVDIEGYYSFCRTKKRGTDERIITDPRISEIIGIDRSNLNRWRQNKIAGEIKSPSLRKIQLYLYNLKDLLTSSVNNHLNPNDLSMITGVLNELIHYTNHIYNARIDGFNYKLLNIFDKHVDYGFSSLDEVSSAIKTGGLEILSLYFGKTRGYISRMSEIDRTSTYMNLLESIYLLDKDVIIEGEYKEFPLRGESDLEKQTHLRELKSESKELIFNELRKNMKFRSIDNIYYKISQIFLRPDNSELFELTLEGMIAYTEQERNIKNSRGIFMELNDLSELISRIQNLEDMRGFLTDRFQSGDPLTKEDCDRISNRFNKKYSKDIQVAELKKFLDDVKKYREKAPSLKELDNNYLLRRLRANNRFQANLKAVPSGMKKLYIDIDYSLWSDGGIDLKSYEKIMKKGDFEKYSISSFSKSPYTTRFDPKIYSDCFSQFKQDAVLVSFRGYSDTLNRFTAERSYIVDETANGELEFHKDILGKDLEGKLGEHIIKLKQLNDLADPKKLITIGKPIPQEYITNYHGQPHHDYLQPLIFDMLSKPSSGMEIIASDMPITVKISDTEILFGHPDFIVRIDNYIYIVDYKPELNFRFDSTHIYDHVVDSVPQIAAGYGLGFRAKYFNELKANGYKVFCYTFNDDAGVIYDPLDATRSITNFYKSQKPQLNLPWQKLLDIYDDKGIAGTIYDPSE
jgi:hypothetical protein